MGGGDKKGLDCVKTIKVPFPAVFFQSRSGHRGHLASRIEEGELLNISVVKKYLATNMNPANVVNRRFGFEAVSMKCLMTGGIVNTKGGVVFIIL